MTAGRTCTVMQPRLSAAGRRPTCRMRARLAWPNGGDDIWRRRITRRLLPRAWRLIGVERQPPAEVLGSNAVRAIGRISDRVHADALGLIDELLAIGADDGVVAAPAAIIDAASVSDSSRVRVGTEREIEQLGANR
jgi:hypothetical protein